MLGPYAGLGVADHEEEAVYTPSSHQVCVRGPKGDYCETAPHAQPPCLLDGRVCAVLLLPPLP